MGWVLANAPRCSRLCDGVQHAHQRGIIHRDLKPANILVDETGQLKLDFGVARAAGANVHLTTVQTEQGQLVGTLAVHEPRTIASVLADIDARTDVYALGVLLYRLLSGRLPSTCPRRHIAESLRRIIEEQPPRIGLIDCDLRGDLESSSGARWPKIPIAGTSRRRRGRRSRLARRQAGRARNDSGGAFARRARTQGRAVALVVATVAILSSLATYAWVQRNRADANSTQLIAELGASRVERGRLMAQVGSLPESEALLSASISGSRPTLRGAFASSTRNSPYPVDPDVHKGEVRAVVYDEDSGRVVSAGVDGRLVALDAATGSPRAERKRTKPRSGPWRACPGSRGSYRAALTATSASAHVRLADDRSSPVMNVRSSGSPWRRTGPAWPVRVTTVS